VAETSGPVWLPWRSSKVVALIVEAVIVSLNVAVTFAVTLKPVESFAGLVDTTVGGVLSEPTLIVTPADGVSVRALSSVARLRMVSVPGEDGS
jgi:hypothetical protein